MGASRVCCGWSMRRRSSGCAALMSITIMQPLQSPEAIRDRLTRSYRNRHREWVGGKGTGPLVLALGAPTEADAQQHGELVRAWIAAWQSWQGDGELVSTERR